MALSMYQASVPVCLRMMDNLRNILKKGEEYAQSKNIDLDVLFNARLAPDMLPLAGQIRIVSDTSKGLAARLAGMEPPKYEDNEKTYAELYTRLDKTMEFLNTLKPEQIDGSEDKAITIKLPNVTFELTGTQLLCNFSMPNLYFHVTTAYNILRHNGVPLAKPDYIGKP